MQRDSLSRSFDEVYASYADMLYRIAVPIVRHAADAEDAVQNTFCRYLDRAPIFTDQEHEKAWFIRVAINQCKDILRRRKVRTWLPIESLSEVGVKPRSTPALDAVAELPEKYKTPIVLYHLEGLSVDEIAAALSLSPSAVKMRLSRARDRMREILEKD